MATAETPDILTTSYQIVHLQYWRWLVVQDATYDQAQIFVNDMPIWENATNPAGTLAHVDREWRFHDVELTPFIDGHVALRWQLTSDATDERAGWSIDDVCVVGMQKLAVCGDGYVDYNEECDDGNTNSGDGCSAACKDELVAGGGGCCSANGGASPLLALVVMGVIRVRRRRATR
jgi:cysteine-rich repeat protein